MTKRWTQEQVNALVRSSMSATVTSAPKSARIVLGKSRRSKSDPKVLLEYQMRCLKCVGFPEPEREYLFAQSIGRKWRFDYCFPAYNIAVEFEGLVVRNVDGKTAVSGRHATITGMREDMVKYNAAIMLGWSVLRFENNMVNIGAAISTIEKTLESKGWIREVQI